MELIRSQARVWVCWLMLIALSGGVWAQDEDQPAPANTNDQLAERRAVSVSGLGEWSLAQTYPERAVWLELEDDARALAMFQPELRTPGRGALIVLANEGQNAAEGLSGPLLQALAERGFAVMTLGLRAPPESLSRRRLLSAEPGPGMTKEAGEEGNPASVMIDVAADDALAEVIADYRNEIRKLLDAAAEDMALRGYEQPAVAGIGWSADYVTGWASGRDALAGVIWLAPAFPADRLAALPELLAAERPWQVLDLHGSEGNARTQGLARAARLGRQLVTGYQRQPVALASPPRSSDVDRLASRISAWLDQLQ